MTFTSLSNISSIVSIQVFAAEVDITNLVAGPLIPACTCPTHKRLGQHADHTHAAPTMTT